MNWKISLHKTFVHIRQCAAAVKVMASPIVDCVSQDDASRCRTNAKVEMTEKISFKIDDVPLTMFAKALCLFWHISLLRRFIVFAPSFNWTVFIFIFRVWMGFPISFLPLTHLPPLRKNTKPKMKSWWSFDGDSLLQYFFHLPSFPFTVSPHRSLTDKLIWIIQIGILFICVEWHNVNEPNG